MVTVGVSLPQFRADDRFVAAAQRAEELGFDRLCVYDHVFPIGREAAGPVLESTAVLAAVAAETRSIAFGPLVLRATLRAIDVVVAAARTLVAAAGRRNVIYAVGLGDAHSAREDDAFGIADLPIAARAEIARELLRRLPAAGVRVWVGGRGAHAAQLAPDASGRNLWGAPAAEIRACAEAADGRTVSWGGNVVVGESDRSDVIAGDVATLVARLRPLVDAGADDLVFGVVDHTQLPVLAEVAERLRG